MFYIGMTHENSFMYHDYTIQGRCWEWPIGPVDPWDEALADDLELFPPVHVHISQDGRDCDGAHGNYWVEFPDKTRDYYTAESAAHYFDGASMVGTLDVNAFWQRQVMFAMSFSDQHGTLTIRRDESDEYNRSAEYSAPTDEGYHSTHVEMCIRTDCDARHTVYDQYAEMMGY